MSVHKPARIGLSCYRESAAWGVWNEPADLLPASYADAVVAAGGIPLLLPPISGLDLEVAAEAALDGLAGLVLSGGPDVDPARYGATPAPETGAPRFTRDSWEIALAMAALARDLPLLGVCRGMQVLAVALGGSLLQHVPEAVGNESHSPTPGVHGRHEVRLAPGSCLAGVLGERTSVATYHHQAVEQLPATVVATGWADDGIIEAFEDPSRYWTIGVQWHPEVHDGEALFCAFVAACTARSAPLAMGQA